MLLHKGNTSSCANALIAASRVESKIHCLAVMQTLEMKRAQPQAQEQTVLSENVERLVLELNSDSLKCAESMRTVNGETYQN